MASLPKSASPTPVLGYSIEYTVATNKVVYATDDNSQPQKYESSGQLSDDDVGALCLEVVVKAIKAFKAGQDTFRLMITPAGKIYPDPGFHPPA
jgi:hypothetical protein